VKYTKFYVVNITFATSAKQTQGNIITKGYFNGISQNADKSDIQLFIIEKCRNRDYL